MGRSVNKVIILGRLGKDPVVRSTPSGAEVAQFSVATETSYKDKSGEWQKNTDWHDCVAWGKLADVVKQHTQKGSQIYLEGRLQTRSWDDKQSGQKRYKTEIIVGELCLLGEKRERPQSAESDYAEPASEIADDDIPF